MRLLILGGTVFLGRHLVEMAIESGHQVTLFNRGRTNPDLFPEIEKLRGERQGDLEVLSEGQWDAVVDTSGYHPDDVHKSAQGLSGVAGHYTFISTISVYEDISRSGLEEDAATSQLEEEDQPVTEETYGPLKAACERAVAAAFDGEVLVLRPGLIVGPHDPTGRFGYWPRRMARGGEVLAPGKPERPIQLIDVRDLAAWILESIDENRSGTYHATGPVGGLTMEAALEACAEAVEAEVKLTWIEEDYLLEAGVQPFSELPLWLPESQNGLLQVSLERAAAAGLETRPLVETAKDTYQWDQDRGARFHRGPGIGPARELALLQAWHAQREE